MEEEIKVLEELIEFLKRNDVEDLFSDFTPEILAIENLIKRYMNQEKALKQIGANLEILDISGCKEILQELMEDKI